MRFREGRLGQVAVYGAATGGGGDAPQTTAFLARTSGLTGPQTSAYKGLINGLVADGNFSILDGLYILATKDTTTAALNLIQNAFNLTTHGTPTNFTANIGYVGDASTFYLDSGFVPSTAGGNFAINSASLGAYMPNSRTTAQTWVSIGGSNGAASSYSYLQPLTTGPDFGAELNGATFPLQSSSDAIGAWVVSRTGSGSFSSYKNNNLTSFFTPSDTSAATLPNASIILFGFQDSTTGPSNLSGELISAGFFGGGLTAAQAIAINNRINTYIATLNPGLNIY